MLLNQFTTSMSQSIDNIRKEWRQLKGPWARYTAAHTALNGTVIAAETGSVLTGLEDALTNAPYFGAINLFYAKTVDWLVRNTRLGRLNCNLFSLSVSGGFYLYALATNDSDPTVPSAVAGTLGLYLTNKHVTEAQDADH